MISDFFPLCERNGAYSIYFLGVPLGAAIGFGLGPTIAKMYGWRMAFVILGIPGMITSFLILRLSNPVRGINDIKKKLSLATQSTDARDQEEGNGMIQRTEPKTSVIQDIKTLLGNPHLMTATAGLIFLNFCLGGLADWYT